VSLGSGWLPGAAWRTCRGLPRRLPVRSAACWGSDRLGAPPFEPGEGARLEVLLDGHAPGTSHKIRSPKMDLPVLRLRQSAGDGALLRHKLTDDEKVLFKEMDSATASLPRILTSPTIIRLSPRPVPSMGSVVGRASHSGPGRRSWSSRRRSGPSLSRCVGVTSKWGPSTGNRLPLPGRSGGSAATSVTSDRLDPNSARARHLPMQHTPCADGRNGTLAGASEWPGQHG
jgi:hypothetical protein